MTSLEGWGSTVELHPRKDERVAATGLLPRANRWQYHAREKTSGERDMAHFSIERAAAIQQTREATKGLPPELQERAIEAVISKPSLTTTDFLWRSLVVGLLVLVGLSLIGFFVLLGTNNNTDPAITVFTALLTGLLGLFIKSPTDATSEPARATQAEEPRPTI